MPPQSAEDAAAQAAALAEDVAAELDAVLLTHFPDADTLDMLRPGGPDLATTRAVNRAVAETLAAEGVEIFVQTADRGAFRRWLQDRQDTPEARRAWSIAAGCCVAPRRTSCWASPRPRRRRRRPSSPRPPARWRTACWRCSMPTMPARSTT